MQFLTVEQISRSCPPQLTDHEEGEEIAPGVVITRRTILRFGLAAAALGGIGSFPLLGGCSAPARGGDGPAAGSRDPGAAPGSADARLVTANELVHQLRPQAQQLIAASKPDEEAYLAAVSALLARMQVERPWNAMPAGDGWDMDGVAYFPPIVLFQIKMKPGAVIKLHDHRHYNGVLLATAGSTRIRNFDMVHADGSRIVASRGDIPAAGTDFLIKQSADVTLTPRELSTLSRDRDNIHHVEAGPDGCELVDFFTHFRPEARSYEIAWDGKPYDAKERLYKVAWVGE